MVLLPHAPTPGHTDTGPPTTEQEGVTGMNQDKSATPSGANVEVLPRRWMVERTLSWLVRCRRLDRDYERLPDHAEAMVKWTMTRRLAASTGAPPMATSQGQLNPFPTRSKF